jgi:hypothetical protein
MRFSKILIFFFFGILVHYTSFTQETKEAQKVSKQSDEILYKILARFPVNVSNKYVYKETSKITRILSNGNSQNFDRELTYHFSMVAPSPVNKDGFQEIDVSVDSMQYKFTNKDTVIYFNDQNDDSRPPKIDDYQIKMVPLGLNFQLTYSPYQEVAKVGGDMLLEKRTYISNPETAPSDELIKQTWVAGLKDEALMSLFDVVKGIPPLQKIAIDTAWSKQVLSNVEGCNFIDSVEFKLTNFNIQSFIIKGTSKSFRPFPEQIRLFGLTQLVDFVDVKGNSEYNIKMHPRGSVNQIDIKYNLEMKYDVGKDIVIQKVETNKSWFLEKMYNW